MAAADVEVEPRPKKFRGKGNASYVGAVRTALARKTKVVNDFKALGNSAKELAMFMRGVTSLGTTLSGRQSDSETVASPDEQILSLLSDIKGARNTCAMIKTATDAYMTYKMNPDREEFLDAMKSIVEHPDDSLELTFPVMMIKEHLYAQAEEFFDEGMYTECMRTLALEMLRHWLEEHEIEFTEQEKVQLILFARLMLHCTSSYSSDDQVASFSTCVIDFTNGFADEAANVTSGRGLLALTDGVLALEGGGGDDGATAATDLAAPPPVERDEFDLSSDEGQSDIEAEPEADAEMQGAGLEIGDLQPGGSQWKINAGRMGRGLLSSCFIIEGLGPKVLPMLSLQPCLVLLVAL